MPYIVCDKCGGYYELQEGENPEDFESCECGGQLEFTENIENPPYIEKHTKNSKLNDFMLILNVSAIAKGLIIAIPLGTFIYGPIGIFFGGIITGYYSTNKNWTYGFINGWILGFIGLMVVSIIYHLFNPNSSFIYLENTIGSTILALIITIIVFSVIWILLGLIGAIGAIIGLKLSRRKVSN